MVKEIRVSVDCEVCGFHKLFTEKKEVFAFLEEMFDEEVTDIVIKKTRHAKCVPGKENGDYFER